MIANSIKITVFVKENEGEEKVKNALLELIPFDLNQAGIQLKEQNALGFNEKKIKILEVLLEKERHINSFFDNLLKNLSDEAKERVLNQIESRIDENCNFFLRFSKDKWINEKELWLTDQGNCFHIKVDVAAFPKKKEIAAEIIRNLFKVGA